MKIGFFGTPHIAAYCLEKLIEKFSIVFAVTPEDKPVGRSGKLVPPMVKETALKYNIPVFQPEKLKEDDFIGEIQSFSADIYIVVAYGKLIPPEIFEYPPLGTINLHPSLLPKYRGAAPIPWVIMNGEVETGVTIQRINEKMDAGDIILQKKITLDNMINAEKLYNDVLPIGADLLIEAINQLSAGMANPVKQKDEEASFCKKITRETAKISWNNTGESIHNQVRGLNPKPIAWTTFRGANLKIFATSPVHEIIDFNQKLVPGELAAYQKKRLLTGTGDGILEIHELQPETKSKMNAASFINGYRLTNSDCFV